MCFSLCMSVISLGTLTSSQSKNRTDNWSVIYQISAFQIKPDGVSNEKQRFRRSADRTKLVLLNHELSDYQAFLN